MISEPTEPRRLGHVPSLDGVRAMAVLSVLGVHLDWVMTGNGVTVFFALSGFLITALLLDERAATGRVRLGAFYMRRALRLLPAMTLFLAGAAIYAVVARAGWDRKTILTECAASFLYLNNWIIGLRILPDNYLAHTWSLSVEEQFYLVWPLLLMALVRLFGGRAGWAVAALAIGFAAERFALAQLGFSEYRIYNGTDTRADALMIGAAFAFVYRSRWLAASWLLGLAGWVAAILLAAHLFFNIGAEPRSLSPTILASYSAVALLSAVLVLALAVAAPGMGPLRAVFAWGPVRYIGKVSYGLYLWHNLMFFVVKEQFPELTGWAAVVAKLVAALVPTVLSYHLVEKPFLRLKSRFAAGRPTVTPGAVVPVSRSAVPLEAVVGAGSHPSSRG